MAKRLIDANSFVIEELLDRDKTEYLDTFVDGVRATTKAIRTAPTVDAVEVVRCRDCYWNDGDRHCMNPKCTKSWYGCVVPNDHFCSYGERKEKEG